MYEYWFSVRKLQISYNEAVGSLKIKQWKYIENINEDKEIPYESEWEIKENIIKLCLCIYILL